MKKKLICMALFISVLGLFSLASAAPDTSAVATPVTVTSIDSATYCDAGKLSNQSSTELATGSCDCSKCRSGQYCCPTANGYCGCFPMPCP